MFAYAGSSKNLKDLKECDPKGSMAFLQKLFWCPAVLHQWLAAKEGGGSATVQASVADLLKGLGFRV